MFIIWTFRYTHDKKPSGSTERKLVLCQELVKSYFDLFINIDKVLLNKEFSSAPKVGLLTLLSQDVTKRK